MKTEELWKGQFGDEYLSRNLGKVVNNIAFFTNALAKTRSVTSLLEFGAGTGQNIAAIKSIKPWIECTAIEINETAAASIRGARIINASALDNNLVLPSADLVLTKGFLIHIPPEHLHIVYDRIVTSAKKYILLAEYYDPMPIDVEYRGEHGRMWKRDFAGELMDMYSSIKLVDYGFCYHRDPNWPQDDITWFLLEIM